MKFFRCQRIFFIKFYLKNGCKNEFKGKNEKLLSRSRNRAAHKLDFKGVWPRSGHAASMGVKAEQKK